MAPKQLIHWTRTESTRLIELYKQHECLYDSESPNYFNRRVRQSALEAITKEIAVLRPEATPELVKCKLANLRTQYCDAAQKKRMSLANGCSPDRFTTPVLWCWNELSFLGQHIIHTKKSSNMPMQNLRTSARAFCEGDVTSEAPEEDPLVDSGNRFDDTFELELQRLASPEPESPPPSASQSFPLLRSAQVAIPSNSLSNVETNRRSDSSVGSIPASRRGTKRRADVGSPPELQEMFDEGIGSIADIVAQRVESRRQDAYNLATEAFGRVVGCELQQLKSKKTIRMLKAEIMKLVFDAQEAESDGCD